MKFQIRNAKVFWDGAFAERDVLVDKGIITDISSSIAPADDALVFDMNNCFIFPGLIDVHVHLREPGFSYKETILTGTRAAARGGFTAVGAMPNLSPVPDTLEHLQVQLDLIARDALVHVYPYAAITKGQKQQEIAALESLAEYALAFTDDGVGVEQKEIMEEAMLRAKSLGKIIAAHCEVAALVKDGCIHDGAYAKAHGLPGISSESEWLEVKRDIELVRKTGCRFHVCHVSTKESVALIRSAKAEGLPVTCETAPHYLIYCDDDLKDEGRFRMNPPLRTAADKKALIDGILDGTIDMIATDHAPHATAEKAGGLAKSANGIVGLEISFATLYTKLVKTGILSLEQLISLMHTRPSQVFGIGQGLAVGAPADLTVFDLEADYTVDPADFVSMGKATPFTGEKVFGKCLLTLCDGNIAWQGPGLEAKTIW